MSFKPFRVKRKPRTPLEYRRDLNVSQSQFVREVKAYTFRRRERYKRGLKYCPICCDYSVSVRKESVLLPDAENKYHRVTVIKVACNHGKDHSYVYAYQGGDLIDYYNQWFDELASES